MANIFIHNVTIVLPNTLMPDAALLVEDGTISAFGMAGTINNTPDADIVDGMGGFLTPGFIDLHIHGIENVLVDHGPDALKTMAKTLASHGVTGFLPTLCPRVEGEDVAFVRQLAATQCNGAQVLGLHLEGPCLALTGAFPPEVLGALTPDRIRNLTDAALPYRMAYSLSPDFPDIVPLIRLMAQGGSPIFMTHTQADVAQTRAAIEAGARHATHFYDAFLAPPETDPGVRACGAVEVILTDPRVSVDFILDGVHVDPAAVLLALHCKGLEGVCLISDANIGAGLPPGEYESVGSSRIITGGNGAPARRADSGVLSGSGLTLDVALRNAIEMLNLDVNEAAQLVSASPARVLGLENRKGRIAPGFDADLVLLNEHLEVLQTWVAGRSVFAHTVLVHRHVTQA